MKRKIIILIGMLFILCGCTAEVNLVVDNNTIDESISITTLANNNLSKSEIKDMYRDYYPAYKTDILTDTDPDVKDEYIFYYDKTTTELDSGYINKYEFKYLVENYKNARSIDSAFRVYDVEKNYNDGAIYISTDDKGIKLFGVYPDLEVIRVRITPKNEVLEANVEPVNGVYTWTFTPGSNNKNIYLKMKIDETEKPSSTQASSGIVDIKNYNDKESEKNAWLYAIGGLIVFFIVLRIANLISRSKYK